MYVHKHTYIRIICVYMYTCIYVYIHLRTKMCICAYIQAIHRQVMICDNLTQNDHGIDAEMAAQKNPGIDAQYFDTA